MFFHHIQVTKNSAIECDWQWKSFMFGVEYVNFYPSRPRVLLHLGFFAIWLDWLINAP